MKEIEESTDVSSYFAVQVASEKLNSAILYSVPSWIVFGLYFIVLPISITVINEKQNGTLMRLKTFPISTSSIEKGKKLFNSNTCNACHQEQMKVVGPALKDIAAKYRAKKGNIVVFLQGKSKAIVDTDPGQVAIMKASLSITKPMKTEDLKAISDYILSIK